MSFRVNTNIAAMNALRNVGMVNDEFNGSINKLSTGLRINSAADDPAGLIISEKFRAQIDGLGQAQRNSQDAINFAKTAEGALDEVNRLLRDARSLAVASSNTATLSSSQLQANQNQLNSIVSSITRIATNTQFGTKKLLDGSSGVVANIVNSTTLASISFSGTLNGTSVDTNSTIDVNVTTAATQATTTGTATYAAATTAVSAGSFSINGVTFNTSTSMSIQQVVDSINQATGQTGVTAALTGGAVVLTTVEYGANAKIDLTDATGIILSAAGTTSTAGTNAVATVTAPTGAAGASVAATFTGGQNGNSGLVLTDADGNTIKLTEAGNVTGNVVGAAQLRVGNAQFQIGANAGQTASLSIGNFSAASIGMTGLDLTNTAGATAALSAIDGAIDTISRSRGDIGSFQRNVLESNIRSLGVAKENLSATESAIRDTDVAEEMTHYTKLQILQQAGMSVLAQANAAPQAVLSLLRQ